MRIFRLHVTLRDSTVSFPLRYLPGTTTKTRSNTIASKSKLVSMRAAESLFGGAEVPCVTLILTASHRGVSWSPFWRAVSPRDRGRAPSPCSLMRRKTHEDLALSFLYGYCTSLSLHLPFMRLDSSDSSPPACNVCIITFPFDALRWLTWQIMRSNKYT